MITKTEENPKGLVWEKIDLILLILALLLFISVCWELCLAIVMPGEIGRIQASGLMISSLLTVSGLIYLLKAVNTIYCERTGSRLFFTVSNFIGLSILNLCVASLLVGLVTANRPDYEPNTTNPNTREILNQLNELKGLLYAVDLERSTSENCHCGQFARTDNIFIPERAVNDTTRLAQLFEKLQKNPKLKVMLIARPEGHSLMMSVGVARTMTNSIKGMLNEAGIASKRIEVNNGQFWNRPPSGIQVIVKR